MSSETVTSTSVTVRRRRSHPASQATTTPVRTPPSEIQTNSAIAPPAESPPAAKPAMASLYAASAVPSLTSASPSMIVATRSGTPRRRITEVAATGSVGPTTAPSTNAAAQDMPATSWATTATATIVATTSPTARSVISPATRRSAWVEARYASEYSSGGRKRKKTTSGSSCGAARPGTNPSTRPPSTRTIG